MPYFLNIKFHNIRDTSMPVGISTAFWPFDDSLYLYLFFKKKKHTC